MPEPNPTLNTDNLPHPSDDPLLKYLHEGKQYTVFELNLTFTIESYQPDTGPTPDGLVIIRADDNEHLLSEHHHTKSGVTRNAISDHIPDESDRAVWTAEGLMARIREFEIGEVDHNSYADIYWEHQPNTA